MNELEMHWKPIQMDHSHYLVLPIEDVHQVQPQSMASQVEQPTLTRKYNKVPLPAQQQHLHTLL
jgi:hypothetical protein